MDLSKIKYDSSIAGYLFKVYLLCIACTPAITLLFFDKFDSIPHDFGDFFNNYFNSFILGAVVLLPALIITLIFGFAMINRFKDDTILKGVLILIFVFVSILSFKFARFAFFDSIIRSTPYQMTFVFLYIIASFAYKLERKQN